MIPQLPDAHGVALWFGSFGPAKPPASVELLIDGHEDRQIELDWSEVMPGETPIVWVARARLGKLAADTRYVLRLRPTPESRMEAPVVVRTLPTRLPGMQEDPFVMLLGSCFDRRGRGAATVSNLPRLLSGRLLPHLKVLCGDQIYLDLPVFGVIPRKSAETYRHVLGKYLRNWAPGGSLGQGGAPLANGYGDLLRHGANLFVSDDHEFWNNYPFASSLVPFTYTSSGRRRLADLGAAFVRGFQGESSGGGLRTFKEINMGVAGEPGSLVIFALDGRLERTRELCHWPADLEELCTKIRGLRSPAILVLSQPLFEPAQSEFHRRWVDSGITDFDDYGPLAAAVAAAPHDLLILSGDIHNGRISECRRSFNRRIFEVIASPLSLIPGPPYGDAKAHGVFPSKPLEGPEKVPTRSVRSVVGPLRCDHIATLEIHAKDRGVEVEVAYWSVGDHQLIARRSLTLT